MTIVEGHVNAEDHSASNSSVRGETYDDLVMSALKAAVLVLGAKIVSVIALGFFLGAAPRIKFWLGFFPHFAFATTAQRFSLIVTLSTLAMALTALILAGLTYRDRMGSTSQRIAGRAVASVIALQTFGLEAFRHFKGDQTVQWRYGWLVVVAGLAGITLMAVSLWKDHKIQNPPKGVPS